VNNDSSGIAVSSANRGRNKARHRLHGVKSSTSSPITSPSRMVRSSPVSSVQHCSSKTDSRNTLSASRSTCGQSEDTSSGSNRLSSTWSANLRSQNYDSDNQNKTATIENGVNCRVSSNRDELRSVRSTVRSLETSNRQRKQYDSDDNGNNTTTDVMTGSPCSSVHVQRCKPRRFKRVMSAGQSLERLSAGKVDDASLQAPESAGSVRSSKREVKLCKSIVIATLQLVNTVIVG